MLIQITEPRFYFQCSLHSFTHNFEHKGCCWCCPFRYFLVLQVFITRQQKELYHHPNMTHIIGITETVRSLSYDFSELFPLFLLQQISATQLYLGRFLRGRVALVRVSLMSMWWFGNLKDTVKLKCFLKKSSNRVDCLVISCYMPNICHKKHK